VLAAGASGFVAKPLRRKSLLDAIESALSAVR
jgi:FixJ family two-component response regulator